MSTAPTSHVRDHPMVMTIRLSGPLNRPRFLQWMGGAAERNRTNQGILRFAGEPELQEFQFFPPRVYTISPVMLLDEPDHIVVLIGRDYDRERCWNELLVCVEQ